jgi:mannitol-specific phosphotransferase system IIBC component
METIMKMPFLLAMTASLVTGIISILNNSNTNQTCVRMIIALVGFYIIGTIVSSTLAGIVKEQDKQKQEAKRQQQLEQIKLEQLRSEQEKAERHKQEEHLGNNLDLVADSGPDDGFSPLDLSQAIRTKVKE